MITMNKSGKPKNYSKGKKDIAVFSCRVHLVNGQKFKLEEAIGVLTPTLVITKEPSFFGSGSRWDSLFDVTYGPVKGAYESDIRKKVQTALDKVGSTALIDIQNPQRTVIAKANGL